MYFVLSPQPDLDFHEDPTQSLNFRCSWFRETLAGQVPFLRPPLPQGVWTHCLACM